MSQQSKLELFDKLQANGQIICEPCPHITVMYLDGVYYDLNTNTGEVDVIRDERFI